MCTNPLNPSNLPIFITILDTLESGVQESQGILIPGLLPIIFDGISGCKAIYRKLAVSNK
jgi:hypothetical protein